MNRFKRIRGLQTIFLVPVLFLLAVSLQAAPWGGPQADGQEEPVHVVVQNNSSHTVQVHILSHGTISGTYPLASKQNLELDVDFGLSIRLEYPPCPRQTTLSQMGSLNETNRNIYLRDDGENIFIQEKFSGARKETRRRAGNRRIPSNIISEPPTDCADKPAPNNVKESQPTRKEDPTKPAPKEAPKEKEKKKKKKKKEKN